MMQWMKRYFDLNYNGEPYDALGRRKNQDLYYIAGGNKVNPLDKKGNPASAPAGGAKMGLAAQKKAAAPGLAAQKKAAPGAAGAKPAAKKEDSEQQKMQLKIVEQERDFYFGKLRDIEMLLQQQDENNPIVENVLRILYATEDEKVTVDESGNLTI